MSGIFSSLKFLHPKPAGLDQSQALDDEYHLQESGDLHLDHVTLFLCQVLQLDCGLQEIPGSLCCQGVMEDRGREPCYYKEGGSSYLASPACY